MLFQKKHKIGDTIAKLRKEKGWTQNELADKLQVSDKAISKWESNKGDPSIEFLPALAELFGVTLDYLMTGKEVEEKIITMSKLELCAKKDDVNSYEKLCLSIDYKDENGKTIFDYIFKYESKNIFLKIFKSSDNYMNHYRENIAFLENFYYMRLLCNDMSIIRDFVRLEYEKSIIDNHLNAYKNYIAYNGSRYITIRRQIISDRIIELLLYGKNIDKYIRNTILSMYEDKDLKYYSPALSYPYIVLYAIKQKDWQLAKKLIDNALTFNKKNSEREVPEREVMEVYLGFIEYPKEVFDLLLNYMEFDLVKLVNETNKIYKEKYGNNSLYKGIYVIEDLNYQIEASKINHNERLTQKEKSLNLALHNDIIELDKLIAINDFDLYEKTIKKYPICECEKIYYDIKNSNYKTLFQFANLNNINYIINDLQKREMEKIESDFAFYVFDKQNNLEINKKYLDKYINKNEYFKLGLTTPNQPLKYRNVTKFPSEIFTLSKNYVFLEDVLNNDVRFIEKACKTATQQELDSALTKVQPNNFNAISILLNSGAKLHKTYYDDDYGCVDEIDEIGTEVLKQKIKNILGDK